MSAVVMYHSVECGVKDAIVTNTTVVFEGTKHAEEYTDLLTEPKAAARVADEKSNDKRHTALGSGDVGDCSHGATDRCTNTDTARAGWTKEWHSIDVTVEHLKWSLCHRKSNTTEAVDEKMFEYVLEGAD